MKKFENFCRALTNLHEIETKSPPYDTITTAGMIDDEELWLEMLTARNDVAHSYNEEIALEIIDAAQKNFIALFDALKAELATNWS